MYSKWTNSLIDDIIDKIYNNVVVPIIGLDAFCIKGYEDISLAQYIIENILNKCNFVINDLDDEEKIAIHKGDYRSMSILKRKLGNNLQIRLKELYNSDEWKSSIQLKKQVQQFLEYGKFPLILTTCNFKNIENLLSTQYLPIAYRAEQKAVQDIKLSIDETIEENSMFYMFGFVAAGGGFTAITENDFLRFLHCYHDKNYHPKNLKYYLKDKHILSLGCEIPDWTVRFLLYSLKEDDFLKENTFGDDYFDGGFLSLNLEEGLSKFLRRISYFSHNNVTDFLLDINKKLIPTHKPKIFISLDSKEYDSIGKEIKRKLSDEFEIIIYNDFASPQYWKVIEDKLKESDFFVPIITSNAIVKLFTARTIPTEIKESKDVIPGLITEWQLALKFNRICIPIYLKETMEPFKTALQQKDPQRDKLWPLFFSEEGNEGIVLDEIFEISSELVRNYFREFNKH
ncbi:MAG: hypothetical protein IJE43_24565 [Alphaproteobacteria bacterium]|nr:hypothetical protein [Alphaproteobacteria bacterium]